MNDVATKKPLRVSREGLSQIGPYIWVSVEQLKEVEKLLRTHNLSFWTEDNSLSMDNGPYMTYIHFRLGEDPSPIQVLLDSIS